MLLVGEHKEEFQMYALNLKFLEPSKVAFLEKLRTSKKYIYVLESNVTVEVEGYLRQGRTAIPEAGEFHPIDFDELFITNLIPICEGGEYN